MVILNRWQLLLLLSAAVRLTTNAATIAAKEPAAEATAKSQYMRTIRDDKERPTALETAIVSFVPTDPKAAPLTVDLVGAVHIGDKSYYAELNRRFKDYDAVLYELVAPEGTRASAPVAWSFCAHTARSRKDAGPVTRIGATHCSRLSKAGRSCRGRVGRYSSRTTNRSATSSCCSASTGPSSGSRKRASSRPRSSAGT